MGLIQLEIKLKESAWSHCPESAKWKRGLGEPPPLPQGLRCHFVALWWYVDLKMVCMWTKSAVVDHSGSLAASSNILKHSFTVGIPRICEKKIRRVCGIFFFVNVRVYWLAVYEPPSLNNVWFLNVPYQIKFVQYL